VSYGSFWQRWSRGVSWTWINEQYRARLPEDLSDNVMTLDSPDRFHAKQGRSTARVVLHGADKPLAVYLKRHYRLPFVARLRALFDPGGKHSPAAAEWSHLERARALGIDVPEVVAVGERIGPTGHLKSFLMIVELAGCQAVNELLPRLAVELDAQAFGTLKRRLIAEMARITAALHMARVFHKDLYLCHFFLDHDRLDWERGTAQVSLIDLHRLGEHRLWPDWWRWKDLGQLLYSTEGVDGITDRDLLRFWRSYCRKLGIGLPRWHAWVIRLRAARYLEHNRKPPYRQTPPEPESLTAGQGEER
jgi:heptose I phosphotransferase